MSSTIDSSPPSSSSNGIVHVMEAQRLLKTHDESVETLIFQEQETLSQVKATIAIEAKKNWAMQKEIADLEYKIRLLVLNLIKAEDMKKLLQMTSFGKNVLTAAQQQAAHANRGMLSDDALKLYQNLFYLLRTQPRYLAELSRVVRGREVDTLLQTVVFTIFSDQFDEQEENLLLLLFERMLYKEFEASIEIGEFMRSNSAFTKMLSALLKRTRYQKFLAHVLSEPLEQVLMKSELNLEINPSRIYREIIEDLNNRGVEHDYASAITDVEAAKLEKVKAILDPRIRQVYEYTALFLKHIFESVRETPYGIRYVCKRILKYGKERFHESSQREIFSLVGGFIFLRFINPAVATCDSESVKLVSIQITPKQRNNLKIICKLLQNLSNGVEFGSKEQYMVPLNEFLVKYNNKMYEYFEKLCRVDEITERLEMNKFEEFAREDKTINISHNEISLVHTLCKKNLDSMIVREHFDDVHEVEQGRDGDNNTRHSKVEKMKDELDPVVHIMQELDRLDIHLAKLPPGEDTSFDLKLTNPQGDVELDGVNQQADELYNITVEANKAISAILRRIPTLPSTDNAIETYTLEQVLLAAVHHAREKNDSTFAEDIKRALKLLDRLLELREDDISDHVIEKHEHLLKEIALNTRMKTEKLHHLQKNRKQLEQVMKNVRVRYEYLSVQLEMFKQFLQDALAKAFKSSNVTSVSNTIGPFKFKLEALRRNGVLESTTVPKAAQKLVRVTFTSTTPGHFHVVARAASVSFSEDFHLGDLLERESKGETTVQVGEHATLNLGMLIMWLNKLFVLGNSKKNKITVIKKPKRRKVKGRQEPEL